LLRIVTARIVHRRAVFHEERRDRGVPVELGGQLHKGLQSELCNTRAY
jgi:hypothetical protein